MHRFLSSPKDFWSGAIFIGFGLLAVMIGKDYSMGTADRMGPGYFPTILGSILTVIGAISVVRSMLTQGEEIVRLTLQGLVLVLGAIVLFGMFVRGIGLPLSIVALIMVSGLASFKFKAMPFLMVAVGVAIFCTLVFVKGLGLPMPIFGTWLPF